MELREAVEKSAAEVTNWSLQVVSGAEVTTHFNLISYGSVVKTLVVNFCEKLGERVRDKVWPAMETLPDGSSDERFDILVDECSAQALKGCWAFFAIGWVMGSAENQAKPRTKETFLEVIRATPKDELRLLEGRFAAEDFLRERFTHGLNSAGMLVSRIFSDTGVGMDRESVAKWCAITSSLPMFEAYELGTRSRLLIEEDLTMTQIASEFE